MAASRQSETPVNDCKAPVATSTLGSKKPSNISRTKTVAFKLPKISLTKEYFGQFKGYIFAVLGHFCSPLRLRGCGSQGLYNRSNETPVKNVSCNIWKLEWVVDMQLRL